MYRYFIPPLNAADEATDRLAWLVLIHWLLYLGQIATITVGTTLLFIPIKIAPFMLISTLVLLIFNLFLCKHLHKPLQKGFREIELLGVLLLDLVQFLLLMSLTQGIQNPFYPMLFVYVTLSAVLLPRTYGWAYWIVTAAGVYMMNPVVYILNTQSTYIRTSALVSWGIQMGVVLATWFIAAGVSQRRIQYQRRWENLKHQQLHLQKVHLLGALGAGMAHEFATPLNTLRLRLDRLHRKAPENLINDITAARQALEQSEQRLKALASLPTQADLEKIQPLDPASILLPLWKEWQGKHSEVEWVLENKWPATQTLKVPPLLLKQSLENLITNALKAMKQASVKEATLTLKIEKKQNQFVLNLTDNGPGWPPQVIEHLGEPFITTYKEGTGLGLYTVFMLAQSMSGELKLNPSLNKGACATLCLPC